MKVFWRKLLAVLITGLLVSGCTMPGNPPKSDVSLTSVAEPGTLSEILGGLDAKTIQPEAEEMRAIWIAYLDLAPLLLGKTKTEFENEFLKMAENCRAAGLNTLVVQVRPFGDSFYPSKFYSWSACVGGKLPYDPMQIMVQIAGEKGLAFHAWVNPMRAMTEAEIAAVPAEYPIRQWYDDPVLRGENLFLSEGRIYLNPASAAARKLISDGAAELVEQYGVDGIHIDDYFYPPALDFSVDAASYAAYRAAGGKLDQGDWRRGNTFTMVQELSAAVKKKSPTALFGVSPSGQMTQNFEKLYIDLTAWVAEKGCLDYLAPQLYYGFRNEAAPFQKTAENWDALTRGSGVKLVVGLAAYKVGNTDQYAGAGSAEWMEDSSLLANQIEVSRALSSYGGVMLFRYGSIFSPDSAHQTAMQEAQKAFLPLFVEE